MILRDEGPEDVPLHAEGPDAERFLLALEFLRSSGEFDWADETLAGIGETVEERKNVTEGQFKAVRNIVEGFIKRRGRQSGYSRPSDIDRSLDVFD